MRVTTGLLLTAALLLPGAAQAQYADPICQIDDRGFPIIHRGIPPGRGGIPDFLGGPFMPGDRNFSPGIRGIPGMPSIGDPFGRPVGVQFPPGAVVPYDPIARFREPGEVPRGFSAIPDIQSLPQVPPIVPPKFDFKPDLGASPSSIFSHYWGYGTIAAILMALGRAATAACGRRSSNDRK
jgi:hypothetical protein